MRAAILLLPLVLLLSCKEAESSVQSTQNREVVQNFPPPKEIDYTKLPPRAKEHIPTLLEQKEKYWSEMENPSIFAAQIEQETCISLTHRMCWSPTAELKTSREHGIGLGQITRAWDAKGNLRFDNLTDQVKRHREALDGWSWKNAANALFQLRALVLMGRDLYNTMNFAETLPDRYAFWVAAYNGGAGGISQDRAVCRRTAGCNPNVWFGNVEHTSTKSKTSHSEYAKSFFQINREYVQNILHKRRVKYINAGME